MSGPPYPPPPPSFLGGFVIGGSQIGTPPLFNFWTTIEPQWSNSPILDSMIEQFFDANDMTQTMDNFYDNIFNVATAVGYGLDVWGRIVGVNRVVQVASGAFFGFQEAGQPGLTGFGQAPFYAGGSITSNYTLSDAVFRNLIFAKALSNIWGGSIPGLNNILLTLFPGRGDCHVEIPSVMVMNYVFNFALMPVDQAIVFQSGVLPQPNGVKVNVIVNP